MQELTVLWLIGGLVVGAVVGWLLAQGRARGEVARIRGEAAGVGVELEGLRRLIAEREQTLNALTVELKAEREQHRTALVELAGLRSKIEAEQRATAEKVQ